MPCAQVGQLVYVLRKRISLPAEKAIFIFVSNTCATTAHAHCMCVHAHLHVRVRRVCIACASHTCRLPPSGALLSSIYLKSNGMVKCADDTVHTQCSRDRETRPMGSARRATAPAHGTPGGS